MDLGNTVANTGNFELIDRVEILSLSSFHLGSYKCFHGYFRYNIQFLYLHQFFQ